MSEYIKHKGRCYLRVPCPSSGLPTSPGSTDKHEDWKDQVPDVKDPDPDVDKTIDRTRIFDPIKARPALVDMPIHTPTVDIHPIEYPQRVIDGITVHQGYTLDIPEITPITFLRPAEIETFSEYKGEVKVPVSRSEPHIIPAGTPEYNRTLVTKANSVMDDLAAIGENFHAYAAGGGGTNFIRDRASGAIYDSLSEGALVQDTYRRANRAMFKGDAALIGVDLAGDIVDAYNKGQIQKAEDFLPVVADVVSNYPNEIVQGFADLGQQILEGNPEAPFRAALSIMGVPSVVKLADGVGTAVMGEPVTLGADLLDVAVDQLASLKPSATPSQSMGSVIWDTVGKLLGGN